MILHNCASTTRVEIVGDENSDTSSKKEPKKVVTNLGDATSFINLYYSVV